MHYMQKNPRALAEVKAGILNGLKVGAGTSTDYSLTMILWESTRNSPNVNLDNQRSRQKLCLQSVIFMLV